MPFKCPAARKAYNKRYHEENRAANQARCSRYGKENRAAISKRKTRHYKSAGREQRLLSKYGMTEAEWSAMFEAQGSCCRICKATEPGGRNYWHTDHLHGSDPVIVRGILCHGCNTSIGLCKESPERLRTLADHVERSECQKQNSTKPTSAMAGLSKRSPHTEPNESGRTNWSAGLL